MLGQWRGTSSFFSRSHGLCFVPAKVGGGSLFRGLLLGAAAEAHRRTKEAEAMGRDRDKAHKEQVKVQGLLDGAIRDKRKVRNSSQFQTK